MRVVCGALCHSVACWWPPSSTDPLPPIFSARAHRFFTPGDSLHPLADLVGFYHASVGRNGHLEIDFAIDRTGGVDPAHAATYATFGAWIRSCYGSPVATGTLAPGVASVVIPVGGAGGAVVDRVVLKEDQTRGQFVIAHTLEALVNGAWQPFDAGVTVGSKRIAIAPGGAVRATAVRFTVVSAFAPGAGAVDVAVFAPDGCAVAA